MRRAWSALLLLCLPALAQQKDKDKDAKEDPSLADFVAFQQWLVQYNEGSFRLMREGNEDPAAFAQLDATLGALARWNTLRAALKVFEAACVDPSPPGARSATARIDFHRELQPWKVRDCARRHIAKMQCPGLDAWLLSAIEVKGGAPGGDPDRIRRDAALRILALRGGKIANDALKKAAQTLPPQERVAAIQTLGQTATLDSVNHLVGLLNDVEPNARIAALNSIGRTLGPLCDETRAEPTSPEAAAARDLSIEKIKGLLVRDPIWQVRSAAAEALVQMRCRAAIPVLIAGLKSELARAKDPWALDLRLHKLLEGMTGQKMLPGQAATWDAFWSKESATFTFARNEAERTKAKEKKEDRYKKFFDLDVDSRRMVFVLDFSGSMAEPAHVKPKEQGGTQAPAISVEGKSGITKAQLVVDELKKMIMALPDGSLFNLIVFSDDVRVWRTAADGKPMLVKIDDQTRDDLLGSFLDALVPKGPTNLYGALDKAIDFAGRGIYDKYYATSFDTLYVLSDGAPSYGKVTDKEEICRLVREANGLRKVVINTVTFGEQNDTLFLKKMAEENGGRHIHVE